MLKWKKILIDDWVLVALVDLFERLGQFIDGKVKTFEVIINLGFMLIYWSDEWFQASQRFELLFLQLGDHRHEIDNHVLSESVMTTDHKRIHGMSFWNVITYPEDSLKLNEIIEFLDLNQSVTEFNDIFKTIINIFDECNYIVTRINLQISIEPL